ncbi:MAG: hypothetical protein LBT31_08430 [Synergistaceae bacterium]|jgi:type IV pilus assembly protein PilQ|nr:hypothetical protein [Synergistaceae bacterium]
MTRFARNMSVRHFAPLLVAATILLFSSISFAASGGNVSYVDGNDKGLFFPPPPPKVDMPPDLTSAAGTPSPIIGALGVTQAGGDTLQVRVRGRSIPAPRQVSAPGENKLVVQFDRIGFPQVTDKHDWWEDYDWDVLKFNVPGKDTWWKQFDIPLLDRIDASRHGDEGIRLTFTTSKPLVIHSVEGLPGSDNILMILKAFEPPKALPEPPQAKVYSNGDPLGIKSPVSLHLRNAELKSVFEMLADIQKLNLLLDPSVPDITIPSISFKEVPFNEAFSYLLRMADVNYSMVGKTLVVGTPESIAHILDKEIRRAYQLSYAVDNAGQVRGDLTAALTALVPLSKPPTLDARNRTLYVDASEEQHMQIAELLTKLDHPGRQIMLQARIVQVRDSATQDLQQVVSGVYNSWLASFGNAGIRVGFNQSNRAFEPMDLSLPIGGSNTGDSVTSAGDTIIDGAERTLMAGLNALETADKAKVLAHPSIITLDGQSANINLAENITYASGMDANGNASFSTVEVGPNITFTPIIGREGLVTVDITIDAGDLIGMVSTGFGAQTPRTANRHVETTVRVRNGEPFVVGGLFRDNKSSVRNRIPIIGYIPLLGDLFTTRNDVHDKSEVAMIVIPYILDIPDGEIDTFDLQRSTLSQ